MKYVTVLCIYRVDRRIWQQREKEWAAFCRHLQVTNTKQQQSGLDSLQNLKVYMSSMNGVFSILLKYAVHRFQPSIFIAECTELWKLQLDWITATRVWRTRVWTLDTRQSLALVSVGWCVSLFCLNFCSCVMRWQAAGLKPLTVSLWLCRGLHLHCMLHVHKTTK